MKYYLINADTRLPLTVFNPLGSLVSTHKTKEEAVCAESRLLAAVRRINGKSAYLPTIIRTSDDVEIRGSWPYPVFTDKGVYRMGA